MHVRVGCHSWYFQSSFFPVSCSLHLFFLSVWSLSNLCPQPWPHRRSALLQPFFGITSPRFTEDLNFLSPLKKLLKTTFIPSWCLNSYIQTVDAATVPRLSVSVFHPCIFLEIYQASFIIQTKRLCHWFLRPSPVSLKKVKQLHRMRESERVMRIVES